MSSHQPWWLHWWFAGFFAGFAGFVAFRGRHFLNARTAWCGLRVAAGDGSSDDNRIEAAVQRRQTAEGPPAPLGLYVGAIGLLLAIVAAFNVVPAALLYAALCFSTALFAALTFWRLRNSQPTRVAVLTVRKSESVIPSYWFTASAISALLLLVFESEPSYELSAILVCISALVTTYIAWRTTLLPAMLSGEDLPAEQLVDDRLRFNRSAMCMIYALAQTFVFWCQLGDLNTAQFAASCVSLVLLIAFAIWMATRRWRAVRLA